MRRVTAALSALAVVLATSVLFAQAKPNFAGTWTREAPAGAPAGAPGGGGGGGGRGGGGGGGWGMEPTITQTATALTVKYMGGGQTPTEMTLTYKLDGSDSTNTVMGRGGEATDQVSKASWSGDKLVIKTTLANGERTQTVSLVGGKLTIESVQPGRDGGPGTPMTTTYTKK
jgi:hypothetical protein